LNFLSTLSSIVFSFVVYVSVFVMSIDHVAIDSLYFCSFIELKSRTNSDTSLYWWLLKFGKRQPTRSLHLTSFFLIISLSGDTMKSTVSMLASAKECDPTKWIGEQESRRFCNKLEVKRLVNAVKKPAVKCSNRNWCVWWHGIWN
jgi:hypothetical protein